MAARSAGLASARGAYWNRAAVFRELALANGLLSSTGRRRYDPPVVDRYRERFVAAGHDAADMSVGGVNHCFVGDSSTAARELWLPRYRHYWEWVTGLIASQGLIEGSPQFDIEELERGPAVFGSAEEVAERIGNVKEKLGLDLHLAYMDLGGLPNSLVAESVDAYASEVAPKVR